MEEDFLYSGIETPQKVAVSVEVNTNGPFDGRTNDATQVMNGISGGANENKGALKFQSRVCVLPCGGSLVLNANLNQK
jgi:hypothetical protein